MAFTPPTSPTEQTPWPRLFTPPEQLLAWAKAQRPADAVGKEALERLLWLVGVELGSATDPAPKAISPQDLLKWVNTQRPADNAGKKAVLTLRWLCFSEIERNTPGPPPKSITHFTPDEPNVQLP